MVKTMHNFKIETPDGMFDLADDFGVMVESFNVSEPNVDYDTEKVDGRSGLILLDRTYGSRTLDVRCSVSVMTPQELPLMMRQLGGLFRKHKTFYLLPDSDPGIRWVVSSDGPESKQQVGSFGEFTLRFTAWQPFAESRGTSLDALEWVGGMWSWGQGLEWGAGTASFTTTSFTVNNAGNVPLDPRQLPFVLTVKGASTDMRIRNLTTGDDWQYFGTTGASDTIRLDGVRPTKSGLAIVRDTNRKLITLAPGANNFTITGMTGAVEATFYFRYYYE